MKDTAKILYLIYILLTVINIIFLLAGHMPAFDAFCTAFGTAGTGGFGIKNDSIAGYSRISECNDCIHAVIRSEFLLLLSAFDQAVQGSVL